MCMEHVEGILAQFDDIFHGLVADDIYTLFSTADQIFSEMAANGGDCMSRGQDLVWGCE